MTIKEMYKYKDWIFLREETPDTVNYYYMPDDNKSFWNACTQYDYLQAKYYGKPVAHSGRNFIEQKESIK